MKKFFFLGLLAFSTVTMMAETKVATFENEEGGIQLSAEKPNWFGADPKAGANEWKSGDFTFYSYQDNSEWGTFYYGFIASNEKENEFTGFEQYRSAQGGAYEGDNFAVWTYDYYSTNSLKLAKAAVPGFFVNNNAYTVASMRYGDSYAKRFGKEDFLNLLCIGKLEGNVVDTVKFALAKDGKYIDKWTFVDLSALGEVDEIAFDLESSDNGDWGMNTPAYFCLDNFGAAKPADYKAPEMAEFPSICAVATFENEEGGIQLSADKHNWFGADPQKGANAWKSGSFDFYTYQDVSEYGTYYYGFIASNEKENTSTGWAEQYRSAAGGAYEGDNFAVWTSDYYGSNSIKMAEPKFLEGFFVNNDAYTVASMCNGDDYAKKFGKKDSLNLIIVGKLNGKEVASLKFALAKDGKYVDKWTYLGLELLGLVDEVVFSLESTDNGDYGMNTPAYFCLDNFGAAKPADYKVPEMAEFPEEQGIENINAETVAAQKIMLNGQLFILRDGKVYNITGAVVK